MQRRWKKRGITLLELLLVIIVVITLAVGLVVSFGGIVARSQKKAADAMLHTILGVASDYRVRWGSYPDKLQDLIDYGYISDPNKPAAGPGGRGWTYEIMEGSPTTFSAQAAGAIDQTQGKMRTIDQDGKIVGDE